MNSGSKNMTYYTDNENIYSRPASKPPTHLEPSNLLVIFMN